MKLFEVTIYMEDVWAVVYGGEGRYLTLKVVCEDKKGVEDYLKTNVKGFIKIENCTELNLNQTSLKDLEDLSVMDLRKLLGEGGCCNCQK